MECVYMCHGAQRATYGSRFFPAARKVLGSGTLLLRLTYSEPSHLTRPFCLFCETSQRLFTEQSAFPPITATFCSEACSFFSSVFKTSLKLSQGAETPGHHHIKELSKA